MKTKTNLSIFEELGPEPPRHNYGGTLNQIARAVGEHVPFDGYDKNWQCYCDWCQRKRRLEEKLQRKN